MALALSCDIFCSLFLLARFCFLLLLVSIYSRLLPDCIDGRDYTRVMMDAVVLFRHGQLPKWDYVLSTIEKLQALPTVSTKYQAGIFELWDANIVRLFTDFVWSAC
jgi:hypothetical protein